MKMPHIATNRWTGFFRVSSYRFRLHHLIRFVSASFVVSMCIAGQDARAQSLPKDKRPIISLRPAEKTGETIEGLDDVSRYLLLMGTLDGLTAAHKERAPCFTGSTNAEIVEKIRSAGKLRSDVIEMTSILLEISKDCDGHKRRQYNTEMFKEMTAEMVTYYVLSATRAWIVTGTCRPDNVKLQPKVAVAYFLDGKASANTVDQLEAFLDESCRNDR